MLKALFVNDVDVVNYKEASCFIGAGYTCSRGCPGCQNEELKHSIPAQVDASRIALNYEKMPITHAIVFGGLEPLEDLENLKLWVNIFRFITDDMIIIYTGVEIDSDELKEAAKYLAEYPNIIFKAGSYIDGHEPHFDELLGVKLASDNQRGIRLEDVLCESY